MRHQNGDPRDIRGVASLADPTHHHTIHGMRVQRGLGQKTINRQGHEMFGGHVGKALSDVPDRRPDAAAEHDLGFSSFHSRSLSPMTDKYKSIFSIKTDDITS